MRTRIACCVIAIAISAAVVAPRARAQSPSRARTPQTVDVVHGALRPEPEVASQGRELVHTYRVLEVATAAMLATTAVFGAFQLYNLPTSFGEGACAGEADDAILGDYACRRSLSTLHGGLGIASLVLYTATGVMGLVAPDEDTGADDTLRDVLSWIHAIGIGLTATLGLLSRFPDLININPESRLDFSKHMRVVHFAVAATTAAAFVAHVTVDLL